MSRLVARRPARSFASFITISVVTDLNDLSTLDIGCSVGIIASELAADGAISSGVDIDVPGLEAAKARFGDRVNFICASADDLPIPDESLDVVIFNHIYEHVVDAGAAVNEIHRVLKPTGVVYLGLANKYQLMEPHYRLAVAVMAAAAGGRRVHPPRRQGSPLLREPPIARGSQTIAAWLSHL